MAQKTLLKLVQQAAGELNLPQPGQVIASQIGNDQKLLALTRAVCDDLLVEHDWQVLQSRYTFNTVPGQEAYDLPADIERFINGTIFDQSNRWSLNGSTSPSGWEFLKAAGISGQPFKRFRIYGNKLYLTPVPGTSPVTFAFEYISKNFAHGATTDQDDFLADSDLCKFDHRVVVYGLKVKWLASIGMDTTAALGDYARALSFAKGTDVPAGRLSLGGSSGVHMLASANFADGSWSV